MKELNYIKKYYTVIQIREAIKKGTCKVCATRWGNRKGGELRAPTRRHNAEFNKRNVY